MAERPEDLNLPQSVIGRIMKDAVPEGISVSKEARNAVSKAASVFVLYATSCANNQALQSKRKTLNANDVFQALKDMEFEEFIEPLEKSLQEFRKEQKSKKDAQEKRKKTKDPGDAAGDDSPGEKGDVPAEEGEGDRSREEEEEEVDEGIEEEDDEGEEEEGDDGWVEEAGEGGQRGQNGDTPGDGKGAEEDMEQDS